jgi:hypothetical protein
MKKTFLLAFTVAALLVQSALAQITFSAVPTTQNVAPGANFNVQIHLSITGTTPGNVAGYNLWLETSGNSGVFSIVSAASNVTGFNTPSGAFGGNEFLTTTGTTHSGFAQNTNSLGFVDTAGGANAIPTPIGDRLLETLTLATNSAAPGTYTFFITNATSAAPRSTGVNDSNGAFFPAQTTGSFSITVIPEPATWSFVALGSLLAVGLNRFRARKKM